MPLLEQLIRIIIEFRKKLAFEHTREKKEEEKSPGDTDVEV